MKTIVKQLVIILALTVIAAPAMATEINKGTKSYQRADKPADQTAAKTQSAEDVSKIAPAAGDQEPADQNAAKKSMKEQLRLPRKN